MFGLLHSDCDADDICNGGCYCVKLCAHMFVSQFYGISETLKKDLGRLVAHQLFAEFTPAASKVFRDMLAQLEAGNFFEYCTNVKLVERIREQISLRQIEVKKE